MRAIPVLLVCGHADTADLYKSALDHAGVSTTVTPSLAEALPLLKEHSATAVVVLIGPGDDPVAIGRLFRQQPGSAGAGLLALSSVQHDIDTLNQALQSFDDAVLIPCTPDALMARISAVSRARNHPDPSQQ